MRTSYDIVTIRERKFRQLKGEEKKNTDYCLCHRKQDSREFIMIHGKRLSKYIFYSSFSLLTFATKK